MVPTFLPDHECTFFRRQKLGIVRKVDEDYGRKRSLIKSGRTGQQKIRTDQCNDPDNNGSDTLQDLNTNRQRRLRPMCMIFSPAYKDPRPSEEPSDPVHEADAIS